MAERLSGNSIKEFQVRLVASLIVIFLATLISVKRVQIGSIYIMKISNVYYINRIRGMTQ